jgi:hypothetical protein
MTYIFYPPPLFPPLLPEDQNVIQKWFKADLGRLQADEAHDWNEKGEDAPHERGTPRFIFSNDKFYKGCDHITVTPHPKMSGSRNGWMGGLQKLMKVLDRFDNYKGGV